MEDNGAIGVAERFVAVARQANLVFISSSGSSLLFQYSEVPEKTTIDHLSNILVELVRHPFRAYLGPKKLLFLLNGIADEFVKRDFNILIQVLEQTQHKP